MPNVFASEDAKALLTVVSKLHPLVVVPPSKFSDFEEPQICWMDDVRSRILNQVLLQYKGALNWMLIADLPRSCLVASVSFFDPGATPSPMDFRTVAVRDLQHLAEFLNDRLGLKTKPSLGIKYSEESIDLPGIEDQTGPGGGICLVADPIEFSRNLQVSTSRFDRELHFWITEEESDELYSFLVERNVGREGANYPTLTRAVSSRFEEVILLPKEMHALAEEIDKLERFAPQFLQPLDRLRKVCRSALAYKLGLYIGGS